MYSIFKSKYLLMGLVSLVVFFAITTHASAANYYFNNAVDTSPATLGNYWNDAGLNDPASQLPDLSVDQLTVLAGADYVGNAIFREEGQNQGTVTGNATFYGDSSENNGTVTGTKTRRYTVDTTNSRDFASDGPWTVMADGAVVDVTSTIYTNATVFTTTNGGSFLGGKVYYFNNAVNTDPTELGNYWNDSNATDPASQIPNNTVDEISINGGANYLGNAIFKGSATNNGTVTGNATFYGDLSENKGTVTGTKTRRYTTTTTSTLDFANGGPWTVMADGAVVDVTSAIYTNATVFTTVNGGSFVGFILKYYFNNAVDTSPATLGNYWNDSNATDPASQLPDLSTDELHVLGGANYIGNAIFRYSGTNEGTVTGNATFYGESSENNGTVTGTKTRRYTTTTTTIRDFTAGGSWTVVADGAVVTIVNATINSGVTFSTINGGSFVYAVLSDVSSIDDTVTLIYSKTLDTDSIPATTDYSVTINGVATTVSNVTISGKVVILTIADTLITGDAVLVDYTPGATPLKSVGIEVDAVTDHTTIMGIYMPGNYYPLTLGNKIYITRASAPSNISVIDPATNEIIATATVGSDPFIAIGLGHKVYTDNYTSRDVSVFNTQSNTITSTISTSQILSYLIIGVGTKVYLAGGNTNVTVIDTTTDTAQTITVGQARFPAIVGTNLYLGDSTSKKVYVVDTTNDTHTATLINGGSGSISYVVAVGNKVYAGAGTDLKVINTTTNAVTTINVTNNTQSSAVAIGTKLYVSSGQGTVKVINTITDTVQSTINVGSGNRYIVAASERYLYVANGDSDTMSVIDSHSDTVIETIPVTDNPYYGAILNGKIYISSGSSGSIVSVIDTTQISSLLPNLTSFSTSSSSGTYTTGQSIQIVANFGRTLQAGSTMTILLNSGRSVTLNNVSGSTLSGTYTVQAGDASPDLAVESITSASVSDTNGHTRTSYDLPSSVGSFNAENSLIVRNLGDIKNIVINTDYASITVGDAPYQISASINGYIYIANQGAGTVSVVRVSDNTLVDTITVGSEPYGLAAVGTKLYVANTNSDTVSVIDTATNTVTATISVGIKPYYVATIGTNVYVTNGASNTVSVINSNTNLVTATIPVGSYPRGIKAHGTDLYVANYGDPNYSGGNYISIINSLTNTVSGTIILPAGSDGPRGVAVLGSYVYVTNYRSHNVSVINTATNTITNTITVGQGPRGIVGLGTTLYVENFDDGTISIIDTNTNTITSTIDVGNSPAGMSVVGTDIYVSAFQDDKLRILDTTNGLLKQNIVVTPPPSGCNNCGGGGPPVVPQVITKIITPTIPTTTIPKFIKFIGPKSPKGDIKNIQQTLNILLSSKLAKLLKVDGVYGRNTISALKLFQKENNLKVDGIFGPKTREVMNKILAGK